MHRYAVVGIETVVTALRNGAENLAVEGMVIKLTSNRTRTYAKGVACAQCGLVGAYFAVEEHPIKGELKGVAHLNLYALKDGKEILMTSDHIVPSWAGGKDTVANRRLPKGGVISLAV